MFMSASTLPTETASDLEFRGGLLVVIQTEITAKQKAVDHL